MLPRKQRDGARPDAGTTLTRVTRTALPKIDSTTVVISRPSAYLRRRFGKREVARP